MKKDPINWWNSRRDSLIRDNQRICREIQQDIEQLEQTIMQWNAIAGSIQSIFSFFFKRK
jgi:hypothetical protein